MERDSTTQPSILIDMHMHTGWSFDCLTDPAAVVETAFARGFDRVCITDHNEIGAALLMRQRYGERVIVGEEVKTAERVDIIGLYLRERIPEGTPARETCERIRAQGGLVYVPHPFAGGKGTGDRILTVIADLVDVVEGFNARVHDQRRNQRAVAWAAERGLPMGAGSDAHTLQELGRARVQLPRFDDTAAGLLAALRSARIGGTASSPLVHLASTYAKLRKRLPGAITAESLTRAPRGSFDTRATSRSGS